MYHFDASLSQYLPHISRRYRTAVFHLASTGQIPSLIPAATTHERATPPYHLLY
jgi:hypothetical protein